MQWSDSNAKSFGWYRVGFYIERQEGLLADDTNSATHSTG
jgi:hypothetical protein